MKTSTQTSPGHLGSAGKVKRIVGKIRRHTHPPSVTSKSSLSAPSSTHTSSISPNCPLRCHRNSQSRRGSAAEEERARDIELWNAAYDALKKDARSNGLVLAYENIIGHELPEAHRPGHHGNPNELPMDGERRLELMSMIASSGLNREVSVISKSDSGDDDAREILVEARSTVASLMPQQPSAALAFAGICSLTPVGTPNVSIETMLTDIAPPRPSPPSRRPPQRLRLSDSHHPTLHEPRSVHIPLVMDIPRRL